MIRMPTGAARGLLAMDFAQRLGIRLMDSAKAGAQKYDRKKPFLAGLIRQEPLTRPGSNKDTRHFEISLKGSGIRYKPGDSLAIMARNAPELVDEVTRLI